MCTKISKLDVAVFVALFFAGAATGFNAVSKMDKLVLVDDQPFEMGKLTPCESVKIGFRVRNRSLKPCKILSYAASCSCSSAEGLPTIIGPLETKTIMAVIKADTYQEKTVDAEISCVLITEYGRLNPAKFLVTFVHSHSRKGKS